VVWLLASATAALGTADAFPAPRHQDAPMQRSKADEAVHHGSTSDTKRGNPRQNRTAHVKATEAEHHKQETGERRFCPGHDTISVMQLSEMLIAFAN
jgi:hypothetical protein